MSKTITIPASAGNRVTIILNGKNYELPTGVEISVPDEVAALLSANEEMAPQTGREPMPWNDGQGGGSGGGGVLVVTATLTDQTHGTCDKTMGEIWTAAQTMPVILVEVGEGYGVVASGCAFVSHEGVAYALSSKSSGRSYVSQTLDAYPSLYTDGGGGGHTPQ